MSAGFGFGFPANATGSGSGDASMATTPTGANTPIQRAPRSAKPPARGLARALRSAGISRDQQASGAMELDGASQGHGVGGRRGAGAGKNLKIAGAASRTPYAARPTGRQQNRDPAGTPKNNKNVPSKIPRPAKHNSTEQMDRIKEFIATRLGPPGVLNLSNLSEDPFLKEHKICPPGHRDAPHNAGSVFFAIASKEHQITPIHTLSLGGNHLTDLKQLSRLSQFLPAIVALDLSGNPIRDPGQLDILGAAKGFRGLLELKLDGCTFREETLKKANGETLYKHDILRRFPGLAILDGLPVPGIRFHVERGPRPHKDDVANRALRAQPFTFPFDVSPPLFENEMVANVINSFCAMFFPLFDNDRSAVVQAYAPQATMSISANTLPSRSFAAIERSKVNPTPTPTFEPWVKLPSRNMTRHFHTQEKRVATLHSGADVGELTNFLKNKVLGTRHPVADASKWCVEGWVVGGEGEMTRLCAVVRGEFEELPSLGMRSFQRTFILAASPPDSIARAAGWDATILSDMLTVGYYFGTSSFDATRSIAVRGASIAPLAMPSLDDLVAQVRQQTGLNVEFATMCLESNQWDLGRALSNFAELKPQIPPNAYL